jgi:hypothetical protein
MLSKLEEEIVSKFVNEYFDNLRMDVVILDSARTITEQSDSRVVIVEKDFLIDKSREYEVLLRNPVEDYFFIPKEIDFYITQFDLKIERQEEFKIVDILDVGVVESESLSIENPRITDNCLRSLVHQMCFDVDYQKLCPEVKIEIDVFFSSLEKSEFESLKSRIGPFMGINQLKFFPE